MNNNLKNAFPNTPNNFKERVRTTLSSLPEKEENVIMESKIKKISFKKKLVVAVATTFVLGTTAFAAGKLYSITSHGSNIPTYRDMPSVEVINKDFGFSPNLVEKFENGYEFNNGYTSNQEGYDENGNSLGESKSLMILYKKGNSDISVNIENMTIVGEDTNVVSVGNYKGSDLKYIAYTNKLVPGDYEMTEDDKKDEASGKYVFSFGSRDIETSEMQNIAFELDGLYYTILAVDSELAQDDLVKMAQEIIDAK